MAKANLSRNIKRVTNNCISYGIKHCPAILVVNTNDIHRKSVASILLGHTTNTLRALGAWNLEFGGSPEGWMLQFLCAGLYMKKYVEAMWIRCNNAMLELWRELIIFWQIKRTQIMKLTPLILDAIKCSLLCIHSNAVIYNSQVHQKMVRQWYLIIVTLSVISRKNINTYLRVHILATCHSHSQIVSFRLGQHKSTSRPLSSGKCLFRAPIALRIRSSSLSLRRSSLAERRALLIWSSWDSIFSRFCWYCVVDFWSACSSDSDVDSSSRVFSMLWIIYDFRV